jgi:hypothetical protein
VEGRLWGGMPNNEESFPSKVPHVKREKRMQMPRKAWSNQLAEQESFISSVFFVLLVCIQKEHSRMANIQQATNSHQVLGVSHRSLKLMKGPLSYIEVFMKAMPDLW